MEAESLKSRCWLPSESFTGKSFLTSAGNPGILPSFSHTHTPLRSVSSLGTFCYLTMSVFSSYKDVHHPGLKVYHKNLLSTRLQLHKSHFQIEYQRLRLPFTGARKIVQRKRHFLACGEIEFDSQHPILSPKHCQE